MHARSLALATAAAAAAACLTGITAGTASAAGPAAPFDVNGDGYRDLVIGVPSGTVNGAKGAGYVTVVPGSASGPNTAKKWTVSQSTAGVPGASEANDSFGQMVTSADLDGNGYADLVVASPDENGGDTDLENDGLIRIIWNGPSGVTGGTVLPGSVSTEFNDVGSAGLYIADVNGDERLDIVTANPGDLIASVSVALGPFAPGAKPAALAYAPLPVPDSADTVHVAVGDIDGDGFADVAAPYSGYEGAGVAYLRGTATGMVAERGWYGERGGQTVAVGDFDKDGYGDVALGRSTVEFDADEPGGRVRILYGSARGPAATRAPVDIDQETPGVPGSGIGASEAGDQFGDTLSAGDVNGDGYADLAVGKPGEGIGDADYAGAVTVLYGSAGGVSGTGAQVFHQGTAGVAGGNETGDGFGGERGYGLVLRDLDRDGKADLTVSAPNKDKNEDKLAGRVWSLPGTAAGTTATGSVAFDAAGMKLPAPTTHFGRWQLG